MLRLPNAPALSPLTVLVTQNSSAHMGLTGGRVLATIAALSLEASPALVGLMLAVFGLPSALLSVSAGRWVDRGGIAHPMRLGAALILAGCVLPALLLTMPMLFASAALIGSGFMTFQVAAQTHAGRLGEPHHRTRNFSMLALGISVSSFAGPLLSGVVADTAGFRLAFAALAVAPLALLLSLRPAAARRERAALLVERPGPDVLVDTPVRPPRPTGIGLDLLFDARLRYVYVAALALSLSWDLHMLLVPILATHAGYSATAVGTLFTAFAVATFLIRIVTPAIAAAMGPWRLLITAFVINGIAYCAYPFAGAYPMLLLLSFVIGLGQGGALPVVLALLYERTPSHRQAEAVGLRFTMVYITQTGFPSLAGVTSAAVGLGPIFVASGLALGGLGAYASVRGLRQEHDAAARAISEAAAKAAAKTAPPE